MPLVFVHGVANRLGEGYISQDRLRDALFRRFLLATWGSPDTTRILSPYWGGHAATARWDHQSIPMGNVESLGGAASELDAAQAALSAAGLTAADVGGLYLAMARRSFTDAVDLLFSMVGDVRPEDAGHLADLAVGIAAYGLRHDSHSWLADLHDDHDFVRQLCAEAGGWTLDAAGQPTRVSTQTECETLGFDDRGKRLLDQTLGRLNRRLARTVLPPVLSAVRQSSAERLSLFLGDVFAYLAARGTRQAPGPIVTLVADAIAAAQTDRKPTDPLVVVAHSMGGNIVHDVLTGFSHDLEVDLLVTVGSQVGYFEELKLFTSSDPAIPDDTRRHARPASVGRWINVFDRADPLSYRADPVFDIVEDFEYRTDAWWAHTAYFRQPNFHQRLAARVRGVRP